MERRDFKKARRQLEDKAVYDWHSATDRQVWLSPSWYAPEGNATSQSRPLSMVDLPLVVAGEHATGRVLKVVYDDDPPSQDASTPGSPPHSPAYVEAAPPRW
jgi:hypothetical protein